MNSPKIAIVGNMNNAGFCIMRYFRDLGADAHLLLYSNDGQDSLSHFKPECDTWEIGKWSPFIHQTVIPNAVIAACEPPVSWLMAFRSRFRTLLGLQGFALKSASKTSLRLAYDGYDCLVGSGITPATLLRINRHLDIFYPYSLQVEFLFAGWFVKSFPQMRPRVRKLFEDIQLKQKVGIQKAKHVVNYEPSITEEALCSIGIQSKRLPIPMVYNRETAPAEAPSEALAMIVSQITESSFSVVHHARLMWKRQSAYTHDQWRYHNKNNDWLIKAFAQLTKLRPNSTPRLFLLEYGPDIAAAKELISELGVGSFVTWLPKMKRKEILWILSKVSVVSGEFYDVQKMVWGGTGWETLATGRPLLQGFYFAEGEFEQLIGHPPPPLLQVRAQGDILRHLLHLQDNPDKIGSIGHASKKWFEKYNGIGIARQWLSLLEESLKQKGNPSTLDTAAEAK